MSLFGNSKKVASKPEGEPAKPEATNWPGATLRMPPDPIRSLAIGTSGGRPGEFQVQATFYPTVSACFGTSHARFIAKQLVDAAAHVDEMNAAASDKAKEDDDE